MPNIRRAPMLDDEEEIRLRRIIEGVGMATWDVDLGSMQGIWSPNFFTMFGLPCPPSGRAAYGFWLEHIHPLDAERVVAAAGRCFDEGMPYDIEYRIIRADTREVRWLRSYGNRVVDSAGRSLRFVGVSFDIVSQQFVAEALRESEERARLVQEVAGIGSFDWNIAANRAFVSSEFYGLYGMPHDVPPVYETWLGCVHPIDRDRVDQEVQEVFARGGHHRSEYRIIRGDNGEIRWIASSGVVFLDEAARPRRMVGGQYDITNHKQTESALRESQARLELALEAAHAAYWEYEIASRTLIHSPQLARLYGLVDAEPVSGQYQQINDTVEKALECGEHTFEAEYQYLRAGAEPVWMLLRGELAFGPGGVPERVHGVVMDVTERHKAVEEIAESEARFRRLAELSPDALFVIDARHTLVFINEAAVQLLRGGLDSLIGKSPFEIIEPEYKELVRSRIDHAWQTNTKNPVTEQLWRRLDGTTVVVEVASAPIRWAGGKALQIMARDITERKRAEEYQRLLISELNHRVKNTLAVVQGLATQSFKTDAASSAAHEAFEGRLAALSAAHNLLTQKNWESASLADVVQQALAPHQGQNRIDRVKAKGPDLPLTPKLAVSVAIALHELATNAVKYGALSNDTGRICVSWDVVGEREPRLSLCWRETGGPPVQQPKHRGFGTRMIERGLAAELNGEVKLDFRPEGFICEIDAPLPEAH